MGTRMDTLPCFTKTITRMALSKDYPGCLPIPKEFYDEQRDRIASEVLLKINSHKKWMVKIVPLKQSGHGFRGAGWTAFVRSNDLEIGDQIMFTMLGPSLFSVRIFRDGDESDARDGVQVKEEPVEVESAVAETAPPPVEKLPVSKPVDDGSRVGMKRPSLDAGRDEEREEHLPRKVTRAEKEDVAPPGVAVAPPGEPIVVEPPVVESRAAAPPEEPVAVETPATGTKTAAPPEVPDAVETPASETRAAAAPEVAVAVETPATETRAAAPRRSLGTVEDPVELNLCGQGDGAADEAGIHVVLNTETKRYKVFISVSAMEAAAVVNPARPDATINGGTVENPPRRESTPVTAPHTSIGPETNPETNGDINHETKPETNSKTAAPDTAVPTNPRTATAAPVIPLPKITIPIRTTNLAPYSRLTIEKSFAQKWLPPQTCNVKLLDKAGKEWDMRWIVAKKRMLTQGWSAIVKHYNMRVGDFCTLEVVEPRTLRFFVTNSEGIVVERQQ